MPEIRGIVAPVASSWLLVPSRFSLATSNQQLLSLLLFVLGVRADHAHDPFAAHDLAVLTDPSDAGAYFHGNTCANRGLDRLAPGESVLIAETAPYLKFRRPIGTPFA